MQVDEDARLGLGNILRTKTPITRMLSCLHKELEAINLVAVSPQNMIYTDMKLIPNLFQEESLYSKYESFFC